MPKLAPREERRRVWRMKMKCSKEYHQNHNEATKSDQRNEIERMSHFEQAKAAE